MTSRIKDARTLPSESALEYDVCIVGTGAAGVTVAAELRRSGLRICVLEGGGLRPDAVSNSARPLECTNLPIDEASRERYFGGTTNTWWGKLAMLDEIDLVHRPWVPLSGWPFNRDELVPYYRRACRIFGIPDLTDLNVERFATKRHWMFSDGLATKTFAWTRTALNFGTLYRRAIEGAPNVDTWIHANAIEVLIDESGARVAGVSFVAPSGARHVVSARTVVLACGGIENARLLLESTTRFPAGVGNDHDQVGRYYMDHPKGESGEVRLAANGGPLPAPAYWSGKRVGRLRMLLGVGLSPSAQEELRTLNSYALLQPVYPSDGAQAARALYRRRIRGLADPHIVGPLVRGAPDVARYLLFKRFGIGRVSTLRVDNFLEQQPLATNRVMLGDRRDRLGRRLAKIHWNVSELEKRTVRSLHERLGDELQRRSGGIMTSPLLGQGETPWSITRDSSHHMGTTRMGVDPRTSVVDPHCEVHEVSGLHIAGSSIFPTSGSANPTLTIVALAARLADRVARKK